MQAFTLAIALVLLSCVCCALAKPDNAESALFWTEMADSDSNHENAAGFFAMNNFGVSGGYNNDKVSLYDLSSKSWKAKPSLTSKRYKHGAGVIRGSKVVVVGGIVFDENGHQTGATNIVEMMDLSSSNPKWISLPPYPYNVSMAGVVGCGGSIYVSGGSRDGAPVWDVYRFDIVTNKWVEETHMAQARYKHALVCGVGSNVFAVGGYGVNGDIITTVDAYQYNSKVGWRTMIVMPTGRYNHAAFTNDNKLIITGGYGMDDDGEMRVLDTTIMVDTRASYLGWQALPRLSAPRSKMAFSAGGKRLYVFGGGERNDSNTGEFYGMY